MPVVYIPLGYLGHDYPQLFRSRWLVCAGGTISDVKSPIRGIGNIDLLLRKGL